jgi:hypothetical protein
MIEEFFKSGQIAFLIVGVMMLEAITLKSFIRRVPAMFWGLCAGACMALALWAALTVQGAPVIGVFLTMSLASHIMEVRQWLSFAKRLPQ